MFDRRLLVCRRALWVGGCISRIPSPEIRPWSFQSMLLNNNDIDDPNRSPDTKKSQVGGFLQGERIRMRFNLVKSIRSPARGFQKRALKVRQTVACNWLGGNSRVTGPNWHNQQPCWCFLGRVEFRPGKCAEDFCHSFTNR